MMRNEAFVQGVGYLISFEGTNMRGRPLGRWEDRVKEYVCLRGEALCDNVSVCELFVLM